MPINWENHLESFFQKGFYASHPELFDLRNLNHFHFDSNDCCGFPTSGTSSGYSKWVINDKHRFIDQAKEVLNFYQFPKRLLWGMTLPPYHVGGFALWLRARLAQGRIIFWSQPWQPLNFSHWLQTHLVEIISLVPTQLFDLVYHSIKPPKSLKLIWVGGDFLSTSLFEQACSLGWPIQKCYGMTETNAFFSLSQDGSHDYVCLPSFELKRLGADRAGLRSPFLAKGYLSNTSFDFFSLDDEGYWTLPDHIEVLSSNRLRFLGRQQDRVKIKGRQYVLGQIRDEWNQFVHLHLEGTIPQPFRLIACPCPRDGEVLVLVCGFSSKSDHQRMAKIMEKWSQLRPWLSISKICYLPDKEWPRTSLGKVKDQEMKSLVCSLPSCL